ncbi:MAG TPA: peptidoglycan-associated lipoprotein Pal [Bryobacteraceae bacterium]|nr:peptidoglycan-associated lipoprotein Pal [Bryobacteraceae bacterium]HPU71977.1 peptidoglycan-associated lipoprotein Pal [Bryobacteraceae bacterium]
MTKRNIGVVLLTLSLFFIAAGCKKKVPPPPPPPPPPAETPAPPPAKPSIQFSAEPSTIERGNAATLNWTVSDATDVSITPGVGTVTARGSRQVYPTETTTYTLTAKGPGGTSTATATVTVTVPPPPPPPPAPPKKSLSELLSTEVQDVYFDYDKSDIREDARATLTRNADALKRIFAELPDAVVVMEGHCDERGSSEYNLGLGDRRATSAKEFLVQLGVAADKLRTISYGKERPVCTESNEDCWQKNRRVHFSAAQ